MFKVVINEKGGAQRELEFDKNEVTIGRVQGNDIILPKGNVSKRHSRIVHKEDKFIVVDLKSTNGTYVNGRKITSPLVVREGDKIYIGDFILTIRDADGAAPQAEAPEPSAPPGAQESASERSDEAPAAPLQAEREAHEEASAGSSPAPLPSAEPPPLPSARPAAPSKSPPSSAPSAAAAPAAAVRAVSRPPAAAPVSAAPVSRTAAPERAVGPSSSRPAMSSSDVKAVVRAVVARLGGSFDLTDFRPSALHDQGRWVKAREAVDAVVAQMRSEGSWDASLDAAVVAKTALQEAVGLGPLEQLLTDERVREIIVEGPDRIFADFGAGLQPTEGVFSSSEMLLLAARRLAAQAGGELPPDRYVYEGRLPYGPHLVVVQAPVAVRGPIVELRRVGRGLGLADLVGREMLSKEMGALLTHAVHHRKNVLVVGSVGTGVTSLVGALAGLVPSHERVVTVEDVADLSVPRDQLLSLATGGSASGLTLRDLLFQGVRLRSDRLVVDDVRGAEALDLLMALAARSAGDIAGVHVDASMDPLLSLRMLARLAAPAPDAELSDLMRRAIQVCVRVGRDQGVRRVLSIAEVLGLDGSRLKTQELFTYNQGFKSVGKPSF